MRLEGREVRKRGGGRNWDWVSPCPPLEYATKCFDFNVYKQAQNYFFYRRANLPIDKANLNNTVLLQKKNSNLAGKTACGLNLFNIISRTILYSL